MITVYVSVGNSDDKLSQDRWSTFVITVRDYLRRHATEIHGEWYSAPDAGYQNACFCIVLRDGDLAAMIRMRLAETREQFGQDSAAWAEVPVTEFV
jgi:hypothetical protein